MRTIYWLILFVLLSLSKLDLVANSGTNELDAIWEATPAKFPEKEIYGYIWEEVLDGDEYIFTKGSVRIIRPGYVRVLSLNISEAWSQPEASLSDGEKSDSFFFDLKGDILTLTPNHVRKADRNPILFKTVLRRLRPYNSWKEALKNSIAAYGAFSSEPGHVVEFDAKAISESNDNVDFHFKVKIALPRPEFQWVKQTPGEIDELHERAHRARQQAELRSKWFDWEKLKGVDPDLGRKTRDFRIIEETHPKGTTFTFTGKGKAIKTTGGWSFSMKMSHLWEPQEGGERPSLALNPTEGGDKLVIGSPEYKSAVDKYRSDIQVLETLLEEAEQNRLNEQSSRLTHKQTPKPAPLPPSPAPIPPSPAPFPPSPVQPSLSVQNQRNAGFAGAPNTSIIAVKADQLSNGIIVLLFNRDTKEPIDNEKHFLSSEPALGATIQIESVVATYVGEQKDFLSRGANQQEPERINSQVLAVNEMIKAGQIDQAHSIINRLSEQASPLSKAALEAMQTGDGRRAEQLVEQLNRDYPASKEALVWNCLQAIANKDKAKAAQYYQLLQNYPLHSSERTQLDLYFQSMQ